jgi:cell division protein FtsL
MSNTASQASTSQTALRRLLHSFRFRLTLLFVLILAVILSVFSVYIYTRQARLLYAEAVDRLADQSAQLAAYYTAQLRMLAEAGEGHPVNIPQVELPLLPENSALALVSQDGKVALQQGALPAQTLTAMIQAWEGAPDLSLTWQRPARALRAR